MFWVNVCAHTMEDAQRAQTYILDIIPSEEDLSNGLSKMAKEVIPETHEAALADGSESLVWELSGRVVMEESDAYYL